jgi:hypothetical protein
MRTDKLRNFSKRLEIGAAFLILSLIIRFPPGFLNFLASTTKLLKHGIDTLFIYNPQTLMRYA